jgi:hypothetical protein
VVEALDLELLARLDAVLLPKYGWQDNLSFAGDGRLHKRKIPSYQAFVKDDSIGGQLCQSIN